MKPGQVSVTAQRVAGLLASAGLDPGRPSLFLLEGVAAYLEEAVLRRCYPASLASP
jgi:O-methyltransferase involved in polyketide biosynthesis